MSDLTELLLLPQYHCIILSVSKAPATSVVLVTTLFQQHLKALRDLVELSFNGNPLCSTLSPDVSLTDHLHQFLPQLEVINGVRSHSC